MLQKLSKCEVNNFTICMSCRFYVRSNFGEFSWSKNVIFGTFKGF